MTAVPDSVYIPIYVPDHLRETYRKAVLETERDRKATSFWIDPTWLDSFADSEDRSSTEYAMKLASIRKGIANFVRIMTKKDIPVIFSSGKQSYAKANEVVVISATNDPRKLDMNVGMALHEAAHLVLSKKTDNPDSIPLYDWIPYLKKDGRTIIPQSVYDAAEKIKRFPYVTKDLKSIINVLEDRRIDNWVYTHAIGYRPYYDAMYANLWHKPLYAKAMVHPLGRRPIWDCYRLHVINMTNPLFDPDALPALREICELVDLPNITRFAHDPRWETWKKGGPELVDGQWMIPMERLPEMIQTAIRVLGLMYSHSKLPDEITDADIPFQLPIPASTNKEDEPPIVDLNEDAAEQLSDDDVNERVVMNPDEAEPEEVDVGEDDESDVGGLDDVDPDNFDHSEAKDGDGTNDEDDESKSTYTDDDETDETIPERAENDEGDTGEWDKQSNEHAPTDDENDDGDVNMDESDDDLISTDSPNKVDKKNQDYQKSLKEDFPDEEELSEALDEQEKALDGEVEKEAIDPSLEKQVDAVEESGAELHEVGVGLGYKAACVVYNKLTDSLIGSPNFPFSKLIANQPKENKISREAVTKGERLGNILAHRLRVMADESSITFTRQQHGKIDKRLIAGLGYGVENVFSHMEQERLQPVFLHLSVDASKSMEGQKWEQSMALAVALAKCAEKIRTLDVVISLRSGGFAGDAPAIAIVYDSRKDKFVKVRKYFPFLCPFGGTPEGLCFEAIKHQMIEVTGSVRKFFVNISDGEPMMSLSRHKEDGTRESIEYNGETAWKHTAAQVQELRSNNIVVLSYYVYDDEAAGGYWFTPDDRFQTREERAEFAFRTMYGKSAAFINPESVVDISRTLNTMFVKDAR